MKVHVALLLVGSCVAVASCGTMHGPADLALGEPREFETVVVRRRVVEDAQGVRDSVSQRLPDEFFGEVVRLMMQGKIGP